MRVCKKCNAANCEFKYKNICLDCHNKKRKEYYKSDKAKQKRAIRESKNKQKIIEQTRGRSLKKDSRRVEELTDSYMIKRMKCLGIEVPTSKEDFDGLANKMRVNILLRRLKQETTKHGT